MKESRSLLILVGGFLAIFAIAAVILVRTVQDTSRAVLDPIQKGSSRLETQVAEFLHPTPTILPDPVSIIHEVRTLARLETIQYSVEKVITAETRQGIFEPLFGDRLLLVAHGTVIAGIDLQKLEPEDLFIQNSVLNVCLPDAEVFVTSLDNEKSFVYDRQTGVLTRGDVDLETLARKAAEAEILETAISDGILDLARQNAENYLSRLLLNLGYVDVVYRCVEPAPTPAP
jgi:Protein of unknown function (DUF4230)